jgi:hypothetical protein
MIPGLGILKLALLSSAFYVGLALLIEVGLFLLAYLRGNVVFAATRSGAWSLFALLWVLAFGLALHFTRFRTP